MSVPGPTHGPCTPWIDGLDVAECYGQDCGPPALLDAVAFAASEALYEISGRRFPGDCDRSVRPCRDSCGCWGSPSSGLGPWIWTSVPYGYGATGWWWRSECGDRCGCGSLSRIRLAGYPVREIVEVRIDGDVLDPVDVNGNPNYRLDGYRWLTRMDDPTTEPPNPRRWPHCQNLSLDPSQSGTFEITYRWGEDVPALGKQAAAQLAVQLWLSCGGSSACQLPAGVTRVVRQNVEVDRGLLVNWFDPTKATGLISLDTFLRAYWSPKARRRPGVYSPDVQSFARQLG